MSRKSLFWEIYSPLLAFLLPILALYGFFSTESPGRVLLFGLLLLTAAGLAAWLSSRRLRTSMERIHAFVQGLTAGETAPRPWIEGPPEFGQLALSLQQKGNAWSAEIRELRRRHQEQKAVLSSMWGAVLAIDHQQRILNINPAAAELFGLNSVIARGRHVQEVIRHLDLQEFLSSLLAGSGPLEGEIILRPGGSEERFLQAHGTFLRDDRGETLGAIVLLHDVTALRRLEKIRREFVANVSHELRTPITSIRGFVETLLDGALEDPDQARKFLAIIARQSDRLNAIIEDLLTLSRIEREAERQEIPFKKGALAEVIGAAVQTCAHQAAEKSVSLAVSCPEDLSARINGPLLEQALVNLLTNAIKYSAPGSSVEISAHRQEAFAAIRVRDHGRGIRREHLDRLFERFYRVHKGRARAEGGTGLGLAIVKHIMLAHHGRVLVESQPEKGSTFTLLVPRNPPDTDSLFSSSKRKDDGILTQP